MLNPRRLKAKQTHMKKRQQPRSGTQANASVDLVSEHEREILALVMLSTGKVSCASVAIHENVQLPIDTVQMLADALSYVKRKRLIHQQDKCDSARAVEVSV